MCASIQLCVLLSCLLRDAEIIDMCKVLVVHGAGSSYVGCNQGFFSKNNELMFDT